MLTVRDIGLRLSVSASTVRRWIADGSLAAVQLPSGRGGRPEYRVEEEAFDRFVAERRTRQEGAETDEPSS